MATRFANLTPVVANSMVIHRPAKFSSRSDKTKLSLGDTLNSIDTQQPSYSTKAPTEARRASGQGSYFVQSQGVTVGRDTPSSYVVGVLNAAPYRLESARPCRGQQKLSLVRRQFRYW